MLLFFFLMQLSQYSPFSIFANAKKDPRCFFLIYDRKKILIFLLNSNFYGLKKWLLPRNRLYFQLFSSPQSFFFWFDWFHLPSCFVFFSVFKKFLLIYIFLLWTILTVLQNQTFSIKWLKIVKFFGRFF